MLRRLSPNQPDSFAFTPANLEYARAWISKYPEGRQQSAVIPLLWRAQEQEGWLTKPAIEYVADMLGMAYIRVLEVATFYFMFQLQPVGSIANIQICGTTTCMICGAEDLIRVCKEKIAPTPHTVSADGRFSWEEVECLGACTNAPMVQIGKDFYEDLTAEKLSELIDAFAAGQVPVPGPQNGRFSSEALGGPTALAGLKGSGAQYNGSVQRAVDLGETVKRIDGTEAPILTPWLKSGRPETPPDQGTPAAKAEAEAASDRAKAKGADVAAKADETKVPELSNPQAEAGVRPAALDAARDGKADDLKLIKGVGPKLEALLNSLGFWHFDQIAGWSSEELAWVDANLEGFRGRASRDEWIAQAKVLANGGETEFSRRAEKDDIYNEQG